MPRFSLLNESEVEAIWTYLQSLKAVDTQMEVSSK